MDSSRPARPARPAWCHHWCSLVFHGTFLCPKDEASTRVCTSAAPMHLGRTNTPSRCTGPHLGRTNTPSRCAGSRTRVRTSAAPIFHRAGPGGVRRFTAGDVREYNGKSVRDLESADAPKSSKDSHLRLFHPVPPGIFLLRLPSRLGCLGNWACDNGLVSLADCCRQGSLGIIRTSLSCPRAAIPQPLRVSNSDVSTSCRGRIQGGISNQRLPSSCFGVGFGGSSILEDLRSRSLPVQACRHLHKTEQPILSWEAGDAGATRKRGNRHLRPVGGWWLPKGGKILVRVKPGPWPLGKMGQPPPFEVGFSELVRAHCERWTSVGSNFWLPAPKPVTVDAPKRVTSDTSNNLMPRPKMSPLSDMLRQTCKTYISKCGSSNVLHSGRALTLTIVQYPPICVHFCVFCTVKTLKSLLCVGRYAVLVGFARQPAVQRTA